MINKENKVIQIISYCNPDGSSAKLSVDSGFIMYKCLTDATNWKPLIDRVSSTQDEVLRKIQSGLTDSSENKPIELSQSSSDNTTKTTDATVTPNVTETTTNIDNIANINTTSVARWVIIYQLYYLKT